MMRIYNGILAALLVSAVFAGPLWADHITNGLFDSNLDGWSLPEGPVSWDAGGFAILQEDTTGVGISSTLEQAFVMPELAEALSFDHSLLWTADATADGLWPDNFTATLWDLDANAPLLNIPGFDEYFYRDTEGLVDVGADVSIAGDTVSLDVSSISAGTNVRLSLDLWYDSLSATNIGDGASSRAHVDNVTLTVIPEPMTVGLLAPVAAVVAFGRRRRGGI